MILANYLSLTITAEAEYVLALLLLKKNIAWSAFYSLSFFEELQASDSIKRIGELEMTLRRRLAWETLSCFAEVNDSEISNE